jgi:glycosyltransferase involved in cell wall biosynthesis
MKILDVSPKVVLPPNTGSRVRMYNLLRHLSRDHEVWQFSQHRAGSLLREHANEIQVTPTYSEVQYAHPALRIVGNLAEARHVAAPTLRGAGLWLARPERLRSLLAWADVVLVEFPWQFAYCNRHRGRAPLVLASHNVEAERFASVAQADHGPGSRHRWAGWIERVERRAVHGADLVLAVSPEDRDEFIRRYRVDPSRVVVVPNGAETDRYVPLQTAEKEEAKARLGLPAKPTVLYVGSDTAPNRAGLRWVRRLATATSNLSFVVVGEVSRGLTGEPFVAPGVVNDLTPFIEAADIAICPIEFGGGTKIKLLEAMSAGLPTVAFAETIEGLSVRHGKEVWVVEKNPSEILAALDRLARDTALAAGLGAAGRSFVIEHHDWREVARDLGQVLLQLTQGREPEPAVELSAAT